MIQVGKMLTLDYILKVQMTGAKWWSGRTRDAGSRYRCGRVGRGAQPPSTPSLNPHTLTHTNTHGQTQPQYISNARFHTFWLNRNGLTDGLMDGRTDEASYTVVCPQQKRRRRHRMKRRCKEKVKKMRKTNTTKTIERRKRKKEKRKEQRNEWRNKKVDVVDETKGER